MIVFDDIIVDMVSNENLNPIITKLFNRVIKLNISLACTSESYFFVLKNIRLNSTHYFFMKITNKLWIS